MGYSGKQTCPRCGRVLVGFEPCPNCTMGGYSDSYQAYGQGVSAPTVGPRLVLLLGAVILLSVLVFLIAPRGGSRREETVAKKQETGTGAGVLGVPSAGSEDRSRGEVTNREFPATIASKVSRKVESTTSVNPPVPDKTPNRTEDEVFWRKKLEHDLREVGEYTPTAEEKAYWEQIRWQDHLSLSGQARTSDYYLRRPELTGGRR